MQYRWQLEGGATAQVSSYRLRADDVPPAPPTSDDRERFDVVLAFARTFDGYRWAGSREALAGHVDDVRQSWKSSGRLPDDLDLLRSCLFHWAQAHRDTRTDDMDRDALAWVGALLAAIRTRAPL